MAVEIVFETHSISEDNEAGIASGWNHSRLAPSGAEGAAELGGRRRDDGIAAVFTSESWTTAAWRVKGALDDIATRFDGRRVLIIGHVATRWALDHYANGRSLLDLATADFAWQEGWEFVYSGSR